MSALKEEQLSGKGLDHLGLVAATIDKLNLVEHIDQRCPVSLKKGAKVTIGQRVAAMILNGLGFMDTRLYMFPEFLENKPIQRLLGADVSAADFNDDCLGRALDVLYEYGVTALFSDLAFSIGREMGLLGKSVHIDTTSLSLYGDYDKEEAIEPAPPHVTYGYPKNKRYDLKQVVLNLATTGSGGFPLWMEAHSGNMSDSKILRQAAQRIQMVSQGLQEAPSFLYVADSAMYESCLKEGRDLLWLSRVPEKLKAARALLSQPDADFVWKEQGNGYKTCLVETRYQGVHQRWCIVSSAQALKRETKTLDKKILQAKASAEKALWHLSCQTFGCEGDAKKAVSQVKKKLGYHILDVTIKPIKKQAKRGRPKKGAVPQIVGYQVSGTLREDTAKIAATRCRKGRFILATNELDRTVLPDDELLPEYKAQSKTETGFRFIKDNAFEVSSIFLKKPSRIAALMMVMTLCLMVYRVAQQGLREGLSRSGETIPGPTGQPMSKPTLKRVFKRFQGVQVLTIQFEKTSQELVINLTPLLKRIIVYFGPKAQVIYGLQAA